MGVARGVPLGVHRGVARGVIKGVPWGVGRGVLLGVPIGVFDQDMRGVIESSIAILKGNKKGRWLRNRGFLTLC